MNQIQYVLLQLFKSSPFWGIVGVIVGFILGEVSRYLRYRLRIRKLKKMIMRELEAILSQIPQKKDIIKKMINSLDEQKVLPGTSINFITNGYNRYLSEIYEHLSNLQKNCLHCIYEYLRIIDETLASFEQRFISGINEGVVSNPFEEFKKPLNDLMDTCNTSEMLIRSYLSGKPEDVFL
jgi:hypothetical protein